MKLKEEIGRNFHSADTDPIPFDYDSNIRVATNSTSDGKWLVTINVSSNPEYSVPQREFSDEMMADHYAKQQVRAIKSKIDNQLVKEYVRNILKIIL
jgi:hypothetical protein